MGGVPHRGLCLRDPSTSPLKAGWLSGALKVWRGLCVEGWGWAVSLPRRAAPAPLTGSASQLTSWGVRVPACLALPQPQLAAARLDPAAFLGLRVHS